MAVRRKSLSRSTKWLLLLLLVVGTGSLAATTLHTIRRSHRRVTAQLDKTYENLSGIIPSAEAALIREQGGAPTYGEIAYPSMRALVKKLAIKDNDVFYDLGSGVGKFVAYVYLTTDIKKSVGIELSESRYQRSLQALQRLQVTRCIDKERVLDFVHRDITQADFQDATVIFMCATCFSNELLQQLTHRFVQLKPGLRIVTLRKLPENPRLKLVAHEQLPTSWSKGSPIYYYELLPETTPS